MEASRIPSRSLLRAVLASAALALPPAARAAATLSNLVVPASAAAGQDVTVSFDVGAGCAYVAIALGPSPTFTCPSVGGYPYPWVLHDGVHYANGLDPYPDFRGLYGGGLYAGCGPQTLSYVIRIPPDAPSPVYVHVFADDSSMVIWGNNACSYDALATSGPINVTGSDSTLRVDLWSQRTSGGEPGNVYQLVPSIRNWGHWPVDASRFCVKMSVAEPATPAIVALGGSHYIRALSGGTNWGPGIATPFSGSVSWRGGLSVCAADRQANWDLQACFGTANVYIPGAGGWLKPGNDGDTAAQFWNGGSSFTKTDDYSQASALGNGFAGRAQDQHYRLYDGGALVCEHDSYSTLDPLTGQDPCGISTCVQPTATATPTASPTASPAPTATATPRMPLLKTVNVSQAVVGDTITYCLDWANDSSAPQTIVFWDTLDSVLTFLGGSPSPSQSGQTLTWNLGSQAPGNAGQACFWVRIDGYP